MAKLLSLVSLIPCLSREGVRRRVSADYQAVAKAAADDASIPKSRGAKPPMSVYQKHHEQSAGQLHSSKTETSSSSADNSSVAEPVFKEERVVSRHTEAAPSSVIT